MESGEPIQKKHGFFTIFLAVVYIIYFLIGFGSYLDKSLPFGPFMLTGPAVLAYSILVQLVLVGLVIGMFRRTQWVFIASLAYQAFTIALSLANKVFSQNSDKIIADAIKQTPENSVISQSDMTGIVKLTMNVTFVVSLIFAALMILFIFLAKKNLETKRII
jgi:hypothetical protein